MRYLLISILSLVLACSAMARNLPLNQLKLPPGFKISLFTDNVPNARSLSLSPSGTLFIGSRREGRVYAVRDNNGDGRAEKVYVLAEGLNSPNGVAFHNGALYVAEINRILRFDDIEYHLHRPPRPIVISTDFPSDTHHGWKFIRIGPDNKLYVPIGAPCNVCLEYGYAAITRLNLDGTQHETYVEGVRNTVGFDWHPKTGELWFTDNGRDMMGDDIPPDELNRASQQGQHFGFPYCHGGEIIDPEFGLGHSCKEYIPPVQKLGAHVASLGMRFYTGKMFPGLYTNHVFIAEHGSWNRSKKSGYRISLVRLKGNKAVSYEVFAEGWLQGQQAWGRPVDLEIMKDGSLLVSDDKAGAVYRIYYDTSQGQVSNNVVLPPASQKQIVKKTSPQPKPVTTIEKKPVKPISVSPEKLHEVIARERETTAPRETVQQVTPVKSEKESQQKSESSVPPDDVIERIRRRTDPKPTESVDPFAPVKKQAVEE